MKLRYAFLSALAATLPVTQAGAQRLPPVDVEAHIIALQSEGSSTVVVDRTNGVAVIQDGGMSGKGGVAGARIDGDDIIDYLKKARVEDIAIVCSHPHADHAGGLKTLVRDGRLSQFDLLFVDDIDEAPGATARLYDLHRSIIGNPGYRKLEYRSARGVNAFDGIEKFNTPELGVSNFAYDSAAIGKTAHDRSVITQMRLGARNKSPLIVDFDDASRELVGHWFFKNERRMYDRPMVQIVAHHGSRNNHSFLHFRMLARYETQINASLVFAANAKNRYGHPHPDVLLDAVHAVGADHVFLTGSDSGDNVKVLASGEVRYASGKSPRVALRNHVDTYLVSLRAQLLKDGVSDSARARTETSIADLESVRNAVDAEDRRSSSSIAARAPSSARHRPSRTALILKNLGKDFVIGLIVFELTSMPLPQGTEPSRISVGDLPPVNPADEARPAH